MLLWKPICFDVVVFLIGVFVPTGFPFVDVDLRLVPSLILLPFCTSPIRTQMRALAASTDPVHGGTDVQITHAIQDGRSRTLSRSRFLWVLLIVLWLLPLRMVLLLLLLILLLLVLLNIHVLLLLLRILLLVLRVTGIWLLLMVLRLSSTCCINVRQLLSRHWHACNSGLIDRRRILRRSIHCGLSRRSFDPSRILIVDVASASKDTAFQSSDAYSFSSSSDGPPLLLLQLLLCAVHSRVIVVCSDIRLSITRWRDRGRGRSRLVFKPIQVLTRW